MATHSDTSFYRPNSRCLVFVTDDLGRARHHLDRTMQPAVFHAPAPVRFDFAFQNFARLGDRVALSYIRLGQAVEIQPGQLRDFYLVQIPTQGYADIEYGGKHLRINPTKWSLLSPIRPVVIGWSSTCELLLVKIERVALETMLAELTGVKVKQPIEFDLEFRGSRGRAEGFHQLVAYICQQLELSASAINRAATRSRIEELLLTMVLESQNHNYSYAFEEQQGDEGERPPRFIKLAIEYMSSHADQKLRLADIATASGASVRSLSAGFRKYRHMTPMEFLRDARLDYVRAALQKAENQDTTVTRSAYRWGFHHLGRFAADYRKRFGENPSDTLRRTNGTLN